ncbi:MMPL family transporter [Sphingomonas bacterium]|uniref:MMPL family transporter n=1 Tax=Sphingomonas bacterium TaxID=1895847 RepID=UPI001576D726|nr:MMPL family transporter [Sphingomonas bacterium]
MRSPIPRLVALGIARPWATSLAALALLAVAVLYAAGHFAMTTDTAELISPTVDWRRQERAAEAAFPQLSDVMLVIVDGRTPELAEQGAAALATRFAADAKQFRRVSRPDGGDFLGREGLLFGSREDVRRSTAALIDAQPLLGPLAADPSLRGVSTALGSVLDGVESGQASLGRIAAPMRALAQASTRVLAGRPADFSWMRLFAGGSPALAAPTRRLILVQPVLDHSALMPGEAPTRAVRAAARAFGPGIRVQVTGEVPLADDEFATLQENIGAVGAVMLGAMLLTLWFATRSWRLVLAIMATIVVGLVVTTAVGLAVVGRLNLISVAFIPLFVGLGVDFGIQIAVRFNAERAGGAAPAPALTRAADALGAPLSLAAAAVFLGFGAFLPTAYVGIAELGVIAGLGIVIALLFSVTLLPALILLARAGAPAREVGFRQLAPVDRFLERRRSWVLWGFAASLAASVALLPLVRFDFNPLHLRDPAAPSMRALADLTRDPERTPDTIDVLAPSEVAGRGLAARLARLPEVKQVVSVDSFVPDDQPAKLATIGDASSLLDLTINPFDVAAPPNDAELVAALRDTSARLRQVAGPRVRGIVHGPAEAAAGDANDLADRFEKLARGTPAQRAALDAGLSRPLATMLDQVRLSLQAQAVTRATLPADLSRDWVAPDGRVRLQVFPSGDPGSNAAMERFRAAVARVTPAISGLPVATQAAARTVAGAFVQAGVIAFVLVSLLLFAVLRDAREVLFTLAPVVLSIFLTLGTCVLIGQPINFANIIAFPLLFGVGVAFHIYFVMAWRGGATALLQSPLARAVLFSALATGTAFGSLWLSHHPGTASMGKILMLSLAWTLVCALVFEPALLGPPRRAPRA